jgi:hypothetical protein
MGENDSEDLRPLARIERVSCLGCSASYVEAGRRRNRQRESRLSGVRLRRLGSRTDADHAGWRSEPLLLGSPAAPDRLMALTPPK